MFQESVSLNQFQGILVEDTQKFALQLPIENAIEKDERDLGVMRRAAKVLKSFCELHF